MLPWWGWVVVWVVLLAGSAAWLGILARRVWASTAALAAEVERAGVLVAELEERVDRAERADRVDELADGPPAAVRDPREVRAERRALRAVHAAERRARRSERLPPWARVH